MMHFLNYIGKLRFLFIIISLSFTKLIKFIYSSVLRWGGRGEEGKGRGLNWTKLAVDNDMVESLWVRFKGEANKADVIVRVYYRPLSQDVDTD